MIRKILPTLTIFTFALMIFFVGLYVYWCFIEPVPLVIKNPTEVKTDKEIYRPGDTIVYTFDYCKTKETSAVVGRKLVDGTEINFSAKQITLPEGCHTLTRDDLQIPYNIDAGIYHLEGTSLHHTNPLREDIVKWSSVEFYIDNDIIK